MTLSVAPESKSFLQGPVSVAGIHLSGANTRKTAVVILNANLPKASLNVKKVYEKIGSYGRLFSDDRLVQLLQLEGPFAQVFIDAPLAVPPCVSCQRVKCPGVAACEDISVAYMMAMVARSQHDKRRRHRPINPQNQRLWDIYEAVEGESQPFEPTYHPNVSQLATRARTLQRRLQHGDSPIDIHETSVPKALMALAPHLTMPVKDIMLYRNFEKGRVTRVQILEALIELTPELAIDQDEIAQLSTSLEVFQGFIASYVAIMAQSGLCRLCPENFVEKDGWVVLPQLC